MSTTTTSKKTNSSSTASGLQQPKEEKQLVQQVQKSAAKVTDKVVKKTKGAVQNLPDKVAAMSKGQKAMVLGAAGAVAAAATAAGVARARKRRLPANAKTYLLEPTEDGWQIRRDGASRAHSKYEVKADALSAARDLAKRNSPSELVIYSQEGAELDRHAYEA